jgi:3-mercaptopyruvate sulfurtransferase SseA
MLFAEIDMMVSDEKWQDRAKGLLKAELARQDVGYKELAEKLGKIGVKESRQSIANKMSRAGFSAAWLLQCLHVLGCEDIRLKWPD